MSSPSLFGVRVYVAFENPLGGGGGGLVGESLGGGENDEVEGDEDVEVEDVEVEDDEEEEEDEVEEREGAGNFTNCP